MSKEEYDPLSALDETTDAKPRPAGAKHLTRRDKQAINDVHAECGSDIGDAFEMRLINERSRAAGEGDS